MENGLLILSKYHDHHTCPETHWRDMGNISKAMKYLASVCNCLEVLRIEHGPQTMSLSIVKHFMSIATSAT